jgi:MFS family permease
VTWILDGLEVTLAGVISGVLQKPEALGLTDAQVGLSATFYLAGNVFGALLFGFLTDRFGRKKLFSLPPWSISSAPRYPLLPGILLVTRRFDS